MRPSGSSLVASMIAVAFCLFMMRFSADMTLADMPVQEVITVCAAVVSLALGLIAGLLS